MTATLRISLLFPLAVGIAAAQLSTSTIRGHVADPTGAAVAGAPVKVVNIQTTVERAVATNGEGDYEVPDLQRGAYRITVAQAGFKTSSPTTWCSRPPRSAASTPCLNSAASAPRSPSRPTRP
jgi:hypothetical protein